MGRDGRRLSNEDRMLWGKVARSVTPLPGKAAPATEIETEDFARLIEAPAGDAGIGPPRRLAAAKAAPGHEAPRHLDRTTRMRLGKGRLPIEAKVDLHGLTQGEAHALLLEFLHRAHADGRRHVLVVTGKGSSLGSEGALRRAVPMWLATPPFRPLVGGHEEALHRHGGAGALYVQLRRSRPER